MSIEAENWNCSKFATAPAQTEYQLPNTDY